MPPPEGEEGTSTPKSRFLGEHLGENKIWGAPNIRREWMFRWAIILAIVALVAALLGFGGIAGISADIAVILLVIAAALFVIGFFFGRGPKVG